MSNQCQEKNSMPDQQQVSEFNSVNPEVWERAEIALRCAPFTVKLLADMAKQGVNLRAIAGEDGLKNGYLTRPSNLISAENALLWLIQVGVLRREVDGQGITDSFRLTPMGHLLLQKYQDQVQWAVPSLRDRCLNLWAKIQLSRFI
ncbi:MAG: hypothetical protein NW214_16745 [Pseudanabaenaceae cyanobacterium bins.39]|nr:hypothetical protein [Pseudanabaenaceae cyanobacterium bins.39]